MMLSERAENIILSAPPAESMILSAILLRHAGSIILSAPPAESVMLPAHPRASMSREAACKRAELRASYYQRAALRGRYSHCTLRASYSQWAALRV
jgi:hypothetical protein